MNIAELLNPKVANVYNGKSIFQLRTISRRATVLGKRHNPALKGVGIARLAAVIAQLVKRRIGLPPIKEAKCITT